jgi:hypothetical protein
MKLTLFHRLEKRTYAAPCDVADVPVFFADGMAAGYIGAAWGAHKPGACLHYTVCDPEEVEDKLAAWGLHREEQTLNGGDDA